MSATVAVVGCCSAGDGGVVAAVTVIVLAVASVVVGVAGWVFGQRVSSSEVEVAGDGEGKRRDQVRRPAHALDKNAV